MDERGAAAVSHDATGRARETVVGADDLVLVVQMFGAVMPKERRPFFFPFLEREVAGGACEDAVLDHGS